MVVVDSVGKRAHFMETVTTITAAGAANLYLRHVWKHHGLPRSITTDRGPQFAAQVMQEINKVLGINTKLSTSFHPQTDGQTEVVNREVGKFLRIFCFEKQDQWADWLAIAQFSINNKNHTSMKKTPFEVTRTYVPRMGTEPTPSGIEDLAAPAAQQFASDVTSTLDQVKSNMEAAQRRMKEQADRHRTDPPPYTVDQLVWLSTENLRLTRASRKLSERWLGPYKITRLVGPNAVELRLPRSMRIHPVVNVSRIKPYRERLEGQPVSRPGPVSVTEDRDNEWEVDFIVDSRYKNRQLEYLVHWKGYDDSDRTWEPRNHLSHAQDVVRDFHRLHPTALRTLSMGADFMLLFSRRPDSLTEFPEHRLPFDRLEVDL